MKPLPESDDCQNCASLRRRAESAEEVVRASYMVGIHLCALAAKNPELAPMGGAIDQDYKKFKEALAEYDKERP